VRSRIWLLAAFASIAWAQDPIDISVALRVQNGQSQFRLGEVIPVELSFRSNIPSRYLVWTEPYREIVLEEYDHFLIEPAQGTVTIPRLRMSGYNGPAYQPEPLGITPITTSLTANDWIAIRQPGHYRITVETRRALHWLPGGHPGEAVTLRSNTIEIDSVIPEPGWAEGVIEHALGVISQITPARSPFGDQEAVRAVRFLGTREAAHAMVGLASNGPPDIQYEIMQGLRESPYRDEIIAELEPEVAALGAGASQSLVDILSALKAQAGR
jgi:hypothetical protein